MRQLVVPFQVLPLPPPAADGVYDDFPGAGEGRGSARPPVGVDGAKASTILADNPVTCLPGVPRARVRAVPERPGDALLETLQPFGRTNDIKAEAVRGIAVVHTP